MGEVKLERTGRRDLALSQRHRTYGFHCPCTDIDLFVEYEKRVPVALVEYKKRPFLGSDKHNLTALKNLADAARVPFFCVRYKADFSVWNVTGKNALAKLFFPKPKDLTEFEWVEFLYILRGRNLTKTAFKRMQKRAEKKAALCN